MTQQLPPQTDERRVITVLRDAEAARPEVRVEAWGELEVVVKDYTVRATTVKLLVGRYLVAREYAAHERLQGLDGVPEAVATRSPYVFAQIFVPGTPAPEVPELLTPEFFDQLRRLVQAIHRRAVAHADLKRLDNIIVQPDGRPALVDWSAAIISGSNPLAPMLLAYTQADDLRAVAKLKQRHAPHLLTEEDRKLLDQRTAVEQAWRWARSYLRPWLQKRADPVTAGLRDAARHHE
ncbi:MAG: hypothetical protein J7M26_02810 [Armatimonadetes bacterium]|nr:hypothetical protein [Armatimonadota bacterium]